MKSGQNSRLSESDLNAYVSHKNILSKVNNAISGATHGVKSTLKTQVLRRDRADESVYLKRLDVCRNCPGGYVVVNDAGGVQTCGHMLQSMISKGGKKPCGCILSQKARDIKEVCPFGYWPKEHPAETSPDSIVSLPVATTGAIDSYHKGLTRRHFISQAFAGTAIGVLATNKLWASSTENSTVDDLTCYVELTPCLASKETIYTECSNVEGLLYESILRIENEDKDIQGCYTIGLAEPKSKQQIGAEATVIANVGDLYNYEDCDTCGCLRELQSCEGSEKKWVPCDGSESAVIGNVYQFDGDCFVLSNTTKKYGEIDENDELIHGIGGNGFDSCNECNGYEAWDIYTPCPGESGGTYQRRRNAPDDPGPSVIKKDGVCYQRSGSVTSDPGYSTISGERFNNCDECGKKWDIYKQCSDEGSSYYQRLHYPSEEEDYSVIKSGETCYSRINTVSENPGLPPIGGSSYSSCEDCEKEDIWDIYIPCPGEDASGELQRYRNNTTEPHRPRFLKTSGGKCYRWTRYSTTDLGLPTINGQEYDNCKACMCCVVGDCKFDKESTINGLIQAIDESYNQGEGKYEFSELPMTACGTWSGDAQFTPWERNTDDSGGHWGETLTKSITIKFDGSWSYPLKFYPSNSTSCNGADLSGVFDDGDVYIVWTVNFSVSNNNSCE
ncbi:hypothetical protein KS4_15440 [Poriferisphaera corsica]|uniref:Uncharacterized protein n=1 Tax=Poriferisphaera corsica TaxID=2528020 RepID=A0A517YTE3_9BACT|nr:hypothetical protein [Poriferisphaera corsica]QDU33494.1 hypothetical protein KS4_15440 [Poriferisphaera corsica]